VKFLLANPAGLWALLAVPAILVIHMLQERPRKVRVSTLFLLERVKPESIAGARIEKLRNSLSLWLQILAALMLTWLICEPRWIRKDARQTLVVVLDSSASMSAFKEQTQHMLADKLFAWTRGAAHTDWHLLESVPRKPTLYSGTDLGELLEAVKKWEPLSGTHAPDDALQTGRSLIHNGAGAVIFVTDHKVSLPDGIGLLSAGEFIENVGFSGVDVKVVSGHPRWYAMIKNYGRENANREWWMEGADDNKGQVPDTERRVTIEPGKTVVVEGEFPQGVDRFHLVLAGDRFGLDDRLPLQRPVPRSVVTAVRLKGPSGELVRKLLGVLDGVEMGAANPDLVVEELGTGVETNAIQVAVSADDLEASLDPAWIAAEANPLTRDLAWSSLLCGKPGDLSQGPDDEPLLWKADRMLAFVRHGKKPGGEPLQRLILNWDLSKSNAARLPAMLVLLQRYVERVRENRQSPWSGNFELGQSIKVVEIGANNTRRKLTLLTGTQEDPFTGSAPERPMFFDVSVDGKKYLSAAAHFADTREADFHDAAPADNTSSLKHDLAMKQTEADPLAPFWVLAVLACLLGSWAWKNSQTKPSAKPLVSLPENLQTSS
jgi:hypothetical protein